MNHCPLKLSLNNPFKNIYSNTLSWQKLEETLSFAFLVEKSFEVVAGVLMRLKEPEQRLAGACRADDDDLPSVERHKLEVFENELKQYPGADDHRRCYGIE